METRDKYFFFWGGEFSNWHYSPFVIDGMEFNCGEQYMMYHKAKFFGDEESMQKIMETESPMEQKKLGRKVKNFDAEKWRAVCYDIVKRGLREKYRQDEASRECLAMYKDKIIVEASPYDRIWGIGYAENDVNILKEKDNWGENLLGKIIMDIAKEMYG